MSGDVRRALRSGYVGGALGGSPGGAVGGWVVGLLGPSLGGLVSHWQTDRQRHTFGINFERFPSRRQPTQLSNW